MKTLAFFGCLELVRITCAPVPTEQGPPATSRVVSFTAKSRLDEYLFRFLRSTGQADRSQDKGAMYKVPLLAATHYAGIGVYKFGLNDAHEGYNVVFRYSNKLVFSRALASAPLQRLLNQFLAQYPAAYTPRA